ncbi:MAG TPA: hypothetical protein ENI87_11370 [bacterium]|nr:hypothetical protein [bacterium]
MDRVDTLIQELSIRHRNTDPRFLEAVRPMVATILDPATPEESRVPLLELLAETFERDVTIRENTRAAQAAWAAFFERLRRLISGEADETDRAD